MRICLVSLASIFFSISLFADTSKALFEKGMEFYSRSDYASAKELLKQIEKTSKSYHSAQFFLGSISAYQGKDKTAYDYYKNAMASQELKVDSARQIAILAKVNEDWKELESSLSGVIVNGEKFSSETSDLAWYYANALWNLGQKQKALFVGKNVLMKELDSNSFVFDMFLESLSLEDEFSKSISLESFNAKTNRGKARLELAMSKKISVPQKDLSLYSLIQYAGQNKDFDRALMESKLTQEKKAPFAWQAALIIAKYDFNHKDYAKASNAAKAAEFLMPPVENILFQAYMLRADSLRMQKKYEDARYHYLRIAMNRKGIGEWGAEALYKTGVCYYEQGDWANAHAYFERVYVVYFKFEYWGARAYYYASRSLYSLGNRRDTCATLVEYMRRAKDKTSPIYKKAKDFYDSI